MRYTNQQEVANHEAAHVVAFLCHDVAFRAVYLAKDDGTITLTGGRVKTDANGTVEVEDPYEMWNWVGRDDCDDYLTLLLAGLCASKVMKPYRTYAQLVEDGTAYNDWLHARAFVKEDSTIRKVRRAASEGNTGLIEVAEISDADADFAISLALPSTQRFVKAKWQTIVTIGDALAASPKRRLTYRECKILMASPQRESATIPETTRQIRKTSRPQLAALMR